MPAVDVGLKDRFPDPVLLIPITSQPPCPNNEAMPVPDTEIWRGGLKGRSWLILDDVNIDPDFVHSPNRAAVAPIGQFTPAFAAKVRARLSKLIEERCTRVSKRS